MAAALRRTLGPGVEVATENGRYGEFKVIIDGAEVLNAGRLAFLGILPTVRAVREVVEKHHVRLGSGTAVQSPSRDGLTP